MTILSGGWNHAEFGAFFRHGIMEEILIRALTLKLGRGICKYPKILGRKGFNCNMGSSTGKVRPPCARCQNQYQGHVEIGGIQCLPWQLLNKPGHRIFVDPGRPYHLTARSDRDTSERTITVLTVQSPLASIMSPSVGVTTSMKDAVSALASSVGLMSNP